MPQAGTQLAVEKTVTAAGDVASTVVAGQSPVMDAVYVSIMAFAIVFAVLIVVAVLMVILGKLVDGAHRKSAVSPAVTGPAKSSVPVNNGEIDDETVAAITAAVSVCMKGRRFRVASLAGYDVQTARWAMAGRQRLQRKKG